QAATASTKPDKTYMGTVVSVNPNENTLEIKWLLFNKKFNTGSSCTVTLLDKPDATIADVRPGEKVVVGYQEANGVRVANSVTQEPMRYEGMVKAIDPTQHTLTLREHGMDKTFLISSDCKIVLRN